MRILHLSTSDIQGGASIAAFRFHRWMREAGIDSQMLVQRKLSNDPAVNGPKSRFNAALKRLRPTMDRSITRLFGGGSSTIFYPASVPFSNVPRRIRELEPDVVNLHWISGGMLTMEDLRSINRPIVWTLHDMWAFTGGCHYSGECDRYLSGCHSCPQLNRKGPKDFSSRIFQRKLTSIKDLDLFVVSPSNWLADCARNSVILGNQPVEVIPNGLDLDVFKPAETSGSRRGWGLPVGIPLILFGALNATSDHRKGFDLLQQAAGMLQEQGLKDAIFLVFGASEPGTRPDFHFPIRYLGDFKDEADLALLYSAADVMVVPSREDNHPLTALEAAACGTPVVSFRAGGLPDIVDHEVTGYLARPFEPRDLARGIAWVLADRERLEGLSCRAREKAMRCWPLKQSAKRYISLYRQLLSRRTQP